LYSIVDIESNGGAFRQERIIEIAIYKFDGHEIVDQFSSLINPEDNISHYVQQLTGIRPKMVKTAPKFHEVARRVLEICEGTILVGHNVDFDRRMMVQSFASLGYEFKIDAIDTIELAKQLIPDAQSYSLGKLCTELGIAHSSKHRAAGDARATLDLFKLLQTKDQDKWILSQLKQAQPVSVLDKKIDLLLSQLSSEPGMIYLFDAQAKVLFQDYARNPYQLAQKILGGKSRSTKVFRQQVDRIHVEKVGRTLNATLLYPEAKSIKESYYYGLSHHPDGFAIHSLEEKKSGFLLYFNSQTQAQKALAFIQKQPHLATLKGLKKAIQLPKGQHLLIGQGRCRSEQLFLVIIHGKLHGFGFFDLHHQIKTWPKLSSRMIKVKSISKSLNYGLKLALLKGEFKFEAMPEIPEEVLQSLIPQK
jgi:DNA polymerase III subunit epsilon